MPNSVTTFSSFEQQDGNPAVEAVSRFVNRHSRPDVFVQGFAREHRTLQQAFMRLVIAWVEHVAKTEPGWYDARNEASVRFAKAIVETKEWKTMTGLPLI